MSEKEITQEELQSQIDGIGMISAMMMPIDNLEEIKYDEIAFQNGINAISEYCGKLTGLINCGLSPAEASEILINLDTANHNLKLAEITNKANIEIAKISDVKIQQTTL